MITVIRENMLPHATAIMQRYNKRLLYNTVKVGNIVYYVIDEGPIGALMQINAECALREDLILFKLV